jgi:serralysin
LGPWTAIGVEQAASGYELAWKAAGADLYTVWNLDRSGNYVGNDVGVVSGGSWTLENLETGFHQDLNGDGTTGATSTMIEADGATSLFQVADTYALGSPAGPTVKIGGAPVVAGGLGPWAPIGAEQTASGYEIAWKAAGADQYTVWNTDRAGNFVSDDIGVVSGSSAVLQGLEVGFQQDLNGDGIVGIPPASLLTNYAASSFVTAVVGNTAQVQVQSQDQTDLTKPHG